MKIALAKTVQFLSTGAIIATLTACVSTGTSKKGMHNLYPYPAQAPGGASCNITDTQIELSNAAISMSWKIENGTITPERLINKQTAESIELKGEAFSYQPVKGKAVTASSLKLHGKPVMIGLTGNPSSLCVAHRFDGLSVGSTFKDPENGFYIAWAAELRDDSNYIRQFIRIIPSRDTELEYIETIQLDVAGGNVIGTEKVKGGLPITLGSFFMGGEHAWAQNETSANGISCRLLQDGVVYPAHSKIDVSSVIGAVPEANQLRRVFNYYIERERPRPYDVLTHPNTWYEHGPEVNGEKWLGSIKLFQEKLYKPYGIKLGSYLIDDGWDDGLWEVSKERFPGNQYEEIKTELAAMDTVPSIWISPKGGYHEGGDRRCKTAQERGMECSVNKKGDARPSASGPTYYAYLKKITTDFVNNDNVNMFKFDGTDSNKVKYDGNIFRDDMSAILNLSKELHELKPDIFLNVSSGSWPSPFKMLSCDSIWRGGGDAGYNSWDADQPKREEVMRYRDGQTYQNIVSRSPLFPIGNLMVHGIVYTRAEDPLFGGDPTDAFYKECRTGVGMGSQLLELYVTPSAMEKPQWDTLVESLRWGEKNEHIFRDTHWIGGNPTEREVYGWASWSPEKSILVLRNASMNKQAFTLNMLKQLELPQGYLTGFKLNSPFSDQRLQTIELGANEDKTIELEGYEVLVFEAVPKK